MPDTIIDMYDVGLDETGVKRTAEDRKKWTNYTFDACQPSAIEDDN